MTAVFTYARTYAGVSIEQARERITKQRDAYSRHALINTAIIDVLKTFDGKVFNARATKAIAAEIEKRSTLSAWSTHSSIFAGSVAIRVGGYVLGAPIERFDFSLYIRTDPETGRYLHEVSVHETKEQRANVEKTVQEFDAILVALPAFLQEYDTARRELNEAVTRISNSIANMINER